LNYVLLRVQPWSCNEREHEGGRPKSTRDSRFHRLLQARFKEIQVADLAGNGLNQPAT
jgi:hypothetical protein